jgi:hypothetical protein
VTGFRRAGRRRATAKALAHGLPAPAVVIGTFAPIEVALVRQFVSELMLLLEAEVGARPVDPAEAESELVPRVSIEETEASESATGPHELGSTLTDEDVDDAFAALTGLDDPTPGNVPPIVTPDDPVVARLLPDAYNDDDDSALEFRRFTQDRLVAGKHSSAATVLASLPDVLSDDLVELPLTADQAQHWLRTLNDVRLAIGTRLDVQQDDELFWDALDADDPRGPVHEIYQWLGWVQETLVASLHR